jgi:lysophospholipase L1-like esterase
LTRPLALALTLWTLGNLSAAAVTHRKPAKRHAARRTASRKAAKQGSLRRIAARAPVSAPVRLQSAGWANAQLERPGVGAIENPAALVPFFEQLYRAEHGESGRPVRILHFGDSHTAADDWTGMMRALLQSRFGSGGAGYSLVGRPWPSYRRLDVRSNGSRGWTGAGMVRHEGDGRHGLGGISLMTSSAGQTASLLAEGERVELFYWRQPGGGEIQISDNGLPLERISTAGEEGPSYFERRVEPGTHRFEVETLTAGPVRLFGWVTENRRGVTYEMLGINGAEAAMPLGWDEALFSAHLQRRDPALIVLAYGTNEAGHPDWTPESYRRMFHALIERLRRGAPAASILVIGPPDRWYRVRGRWVPLQKVDMIVEAQRDVALAGGCAFWDWRERMGGPGAMPRWVQAGLAQPDHVHLTGAGYRMLGEALYRELMSQYGAFAAARGSLAEIGNNGQEK